MSKIRFASEEYVDRKLSGAATVQPDWAQNDAAASDYIKNRTHWVEDEFIVTISNETIYDLNGVKQWSYGGSTLGTNNTLNARAEWIVKIDNNFFISFFAAKPLFLSC